MNGLVSTIETESVSKQMSQLQQDSTSIEAICKVDAACIYKDKFYLEQGSSCEVFHLSRLSNLVCWLERRQTLIEGYSQPTEHLGGIQRGLYSHDLLYYQITSVVTSRAS